MRSRYIGSTKRNNGSRLASAKIQSRKNSVRKAMLPPRNRKEGLYDSRIQGSRGPGSEEYAPLTIPNQSQTPVSTLSQLQQPPVRSESGTDGRDLDPVYTPLTLMPLSLNMPSCTSSQSNCRLPGSFVCVYSQPPTARRCEAAFVSSEIRR